MSVDNHVDNLWTMANLTPAQTQARALGAQCDRCPFQGQTPVHGVHPRGAVACVVGEAPGNEEVKHGQPFIGPSGQLLDKALAHAGLTRAQVGVTNALLCRPPGDLQDELRKISKENQARAARGETPIGDPIASCRPRLLRELAGYSNLLPVGKASIHALTGRPASIQALRGAIMELQIPDVPGGPPRARQAVPALHPAHVLRQKRWIRTFFDDLAKAVRLFRGKLNWTEPVAVYHPRPAELRALLKGTGQGPGRCAGLRHPGWVAWDVETDGIESLTCGMRCIGFGGLDPGGNASRDWAVVVGVRPIAWAKKGSDPDAWARHEEALCHPEGWPWYAEGELEEIKGILREAMAGTGDFAGLVKIGHNAGYYDRTVVEQWLSPERAIHHGAASPEAAAGQWALRVPMWPGLCIAPALDTILFHRLVASELPHSLDYVGTVLTDIHKWKAGHVAVESDSDEELHVYNGPGDCAVSARIVPPLLAGVQRRSLTHLIEPHHSVQAMCAGIHRNGLWVAQPWRERTEQWLEAVYLRTETVCQAGAAATGWRPKPGAEKGTGGRRGQAEVALAAEAAGAGDPLEAEGPGSRGARSLRELSLAEAGAPRRVVPGHLHNPRSFPQVAHLLYEVWGFTPPAYTDGGEGSTDDASLRALRRDSRLTDAQRAYLDALRQHRSAQKSSASVRPMRPYGMTWVGSDGEARRGGVLYDERIHPNYNAHVPVTARISSSNPNFQNVEKIFRILCQPMPEDAQVRAYGRAFGRRKYVGADVDQLELRLAAALAGCEKYLDAFVSGGDPHAMTAEMLYGARFASELTHLRRTGKKTQAFTDMRNFAKTFVYLVIFGGSGETAWNNLTASEDAQGRLIYANVKLGEVEALRDRWLREAGEFPRWWERTVTEYRKQGFLLDPIDGMCRDFLDGEDFNEIVNFKVQAGGAAVVRRMTARLLGGLRDDGPLGFEKSWSRWGPGAGLVTQTHDSNVFEVGAADAGHGPDQDDSGHKAPGAQATGICAQVQEAMTYEHPGLPVRFTATAVAADNWMAA